MADTPAASPSSQEKNSTVWESEGIIEKVDQSQLNGAQLWCQFLKPQQEGDFGRIGGVWRLFMDDILVPRATERDTRPASRQDFESHRSIRAQVERAQVQVQTDNRWSGRGNLAQQTAFQNLKTLLATAPVLNPIKMQEDPLRCRPRRQQLWVGSSSPPAARGDQWKPVAYASRRLKRH
ncbi:hypothetical protein NFI96_025942 [Prochilodus magdalenae]|nr:hypothetical protein NFI96_025942 [Prochilodus magdalenae]